MLGNVHSQSYKPGQEERMVLSSSLVVSLLETEMRSWLGTVGSAGKDWEKISLMVVSGGFCEEESSVFLPFYFPWGIGH